MSTKNILDIDPQDTATLTTEYSIVDSIIAEHEYVQIMNQLGVLTSEMAIAEQASLAVYSYENGLTTENSQDKLTKLYQELNLRDDQLATLTTEGASEVIDNIKAMIKKIWDQAKLTYQKLLVQALQYIDQTKKTANTLKKHIEENCGDNVDKTKYVKRDAILHTHLTLFNEYTLNTITKIVNFTSIDANPYDLLAAIKKYYNGGGIVAFDSIINTEQFSKIDVKGEVITGCLLSPCGATLPILVIGSPDGQNDSDFLKISYVDAPSKVMWDIEILNKQKLLAVIELILDMDVGRARDVVKIDLIKEIGGISIDSSKPPSDKIGPVYMANMFTRTVLITISEKMKTAKTLLTLVAWNAKMLEDKK